MLMVMRFQIILLLNYWIIRFLNKMSLDTNVIKMWVVLIILVISLSFNLVLTGMVIFQDKEPIKIGGAFGLTGYAAEWGDADMNGAKLAIEEINEREGIHGRKIELINEDIQSDGVKTVNAVNKLINFDSVDVILGPTWLDTYGGAAPLSDEHDILMITPSASINAIKSSENYKNVFSTWYRSDEEAKALAEHLSNTNQKKVVLFFGNDPFWQDIANKIKDSDDLDIIKNVKVTSKETDFRTELSKIKRLKPDVIIFGLNDESSQFLFLKQRKELYPKSILYSTESFEEFTKKQDYQQLINNVFFVSPADVDQNFVEKYRNRFGKDPVFSASNSYDAVKILLEAIQETASTDTDDLREYIMNNEFDTVTFGKTRFDRIGGVTGGSFVIKNSKREIIEFLGI
ncbi:ABC transporter substrate-binding protein [Candidatus Pacearchaeota archaeon]|nr:ABC transporter substrate-binding protein [Candidatus Pacearchaeota archaeon]MBD3282934.1 ABC transporter substrate-binding protein [Candidatus Pacearchaeota archaeon]